jgi:hypothetical protein
MSLKLAPKVLYVVTVDMYILLYIFIKKYFYILKINLNIKDNLLYIINQIQ